MPDTQSSNSTGLRAEAREFIPKSENNESASDKQTGTIPKKKKAGTNNWRKNKLIRDPPNRHEQSGNQTFFKDNQSYNNNNENNGGGYYRSVRNNAPKRRDDLRLDHVYYDNNRNSRSKTSDDCSQDTYDRKPKPPQDSYDRKPKPPQDSYDRKPKPPQDTYDRKPKPHRNIQQRTTKKEPIKVSQLMQREQLTLEIENNTLECMICCERIRDYQATWNCSNCYHIQHLSCIKNWISNSKVDGEWRCVACQYLRVEAPKDYACFCGKEKFPALNRNDLAHSCGNMCSRVDKCPHPCGLKCHPGPHATCQSFVQRFCGCEKASKTFQCSMKETSFQCEEVCGKMLNCGLHKCVTQCHQGECEKCPELIKMNCFCGKEAKVESCSLEISPTMQFACNQNCDKLLECQNHRCEVKCHPGDCDRCPLSTDLVKTCPCGKTTIKEDQRLACTDPIPLCKASCSKTLKCGPATSPHFCARNCHQADCPPCSKTTQVKCRCGRIEEKIPCKDLVNIDVRCKKKCTKFRTCGKHRCGKDCCIDLDHICNQQCGKFLDCKKHRCQRSCHIGNCSSCPRVSFDELRCECNAAVIYPPVPCGTRVPECTNKCKRRHSCDHPVNHLCHSDPECPPCVFLTTKFCFGEHEQRKTIICSQDSFSCGMPCGKELKCNRHKCVKKCHEGICEKASDTCKQLCTTKRDCLHNCNAVCHEEACPDKPCRILTEVSCQCGNLKEMKTCEQVTYENRKIQRMKLAMKDGDEFENMKDVYGEPAKVTHKLLECNNACATLERNRRLDIAFKVENPNLSSYPKFTPNYSEFIRSFYKKEPACVKMIHEKLTELVKLAKESKQTQRSYSFPIMRRDKRQAVHELASLFGVETKAYDQEPNRNVVATASRESCWLPSVSIIELVQRETGLRIVRPPSTQMKK